MSVNSKSPLPPSSQRDVFLAALEVSNLVERSAFLESTCGNDHDLRRRVEELLAEQEQLGTFLDTPALGGERQPGTIIDGSSARRAGATITSAKVGDRIGHYKLLQEIGEGGCGSVYMAEQEEPVRRRVALKVIKAGMDTKSVIARFEAERQALALMDHPNIAKVLDAGTTESSRPYFVMELVRGIRITEYCDQNNLATRERLDLFIKVCQAIQHAHQKGIIHRDIKPSNILVTLHDGVPVPKVIDFGIAKAIEQRLTDKTVFTAFEQFMGTPAYMSPEQAEMSGLDIDTRSDIYSLGVLLYEMLTGKTPFDGKELVESGLDAMRRTIREKEPLRPSTRLRTLEMAEATDLVKYRQEKLPALVKMIRGDLDWIVMKAVAKDRTRRYETANGLAMDIQRYLNGEAISARPPSRVYRLKKFVRRNKLLVSAGACVLVVLFLATVVSSWQAIRATRAEREQSYLLRAAEAARQKEVRLRQRTETERLAALRRAYNSDMNLVPQALLANNYGRVVDLLNRHRRKKNPEIRNGKSELEPDFREWEWRYFWNQARSDAAFALPRQSNTITALAISSDGRFLASSDRSGTLKLWDLFRRSEIATLREGRGGGGPGGSPFAFSPKGDRLVVALSEHPRRTVVKVWATATREVTEEVVVNSGVQALSFSTNGARLLLFGEDHAVRAWDFTTNEPVFQTPARKQGGRFPRSFGATFSPDAKLVAFTEAGRIQVIDAETGIEKSSMLAFEQVAALAFSPDGGLIAASPFFTEVETAIKLFSTTTGAEVGKLAGHVSWIPSVIFSSDGKRVISAGADQTVRIWNVVEGQDEGQELAALQGHLSEVNCVAISSDGKTIVSGCKDGTLFGWDAERTERKKHYETLPAQIANIEFFPDSHSMLSVNRNGNVVLWDATTFQERERISALGNNVERIVISPDGTRLYAGSRDGPITVLDWATRSVVTNLATSAGRRSPVIPIGVLDKGRTLITAGPESAIRLWDTTSWLFKVLAKPKPGTPFFGVHFAISPDERLLAEDCFERGVDILNISSGQTETNLNVENWGSAGMALSPDGTLLARASREGTVNLWNVSKHSMVDVLRGHLLGVHDVAFSPDGQRLASASAKSEAVKLWDVTSRHEVATLAGEGSLFERVKFSPDGTLLVAINSQGKAHFWRAPSLQEIEKIDEGNR